MNDSAPADTVADRDLDVITSLDELAALVDDDVYVRYSKGPDDDRNTTSRDYESGLDLPGLSVNPLAPEAWWQRPVEDWLARQICNYVHIQEESDDERRGWVLRGSVAARGPDNEPLITDYRPLAWLSDEVIAEAKRRYQSRFDVASDSTD